MIRDEDIICISSIDWDFIWQGHQEIMTKLARNGNRVIFVENTGVRIPTIRDLGRIKNRIYNWRKGVHGIRKIEDGLYVYAPLILPFPYSKVARFINKRLIFSVLLRWLKAVGFAEPITWVFLPTGLSLDLVNEIEPKVLIYYCIDSFQASSREAIKIERTETLILKRADLVFATSQALLNHCARHNAHTHYFPFGVNIDNFLRAMDDNKSAPLDMEKIKRPIAGYVGGLHRWIDFGLVKFLATENSDISFVFCGPIQTDVSAVKDLPNVMLLGQKSPQDLPYYVKEFDIALIPYKITEYTRNVYPTKLNEYLSVGKPVISTNLPEIIKFNNENGGIVKTATDKEEFSRRLREAIHHPPQEDEKVLATNVARKNSWSSRLEEMSSLIEGVIYEKTKMREESWRDNISRIYIRAREKLMPALIGVVLLYIAVFRSPLIWALAKPLQIIDAPQKADVIVALAGGVGELGKVGQGHEERTDAAVKLYKNGFAKKIIYSSGYRYIMKEAEVMRALSIFMGVEKNDMILDDTPVNTYEMIMHLKAFIEKNKWKSAILISSPYHMKRVKLLCDKQLKDIRVYYVPVEQSNFYAHNTWIKIRHISGILHEYAALIYYKLKNYI